MSCLNLFSEEAASLILQIPCGSQSVSVSSLTFSLLPWINSFVIYCQFNSISHLRGIRICYAGVSKLKRHLPNLASFPYSFFHFPLRFRALSQAYCNGLCYSQRNGVWT
ncbi:MAG: hypothetical protein FRX48_06038 [Lasallia pustulata]|uniref:Uncharacterized protein n=1 Tax=Lasallia pustulata TaxID=136370 RepID=A0A5M8PNX3_9LECA|nr:MAG: hypothetical protein FRX48_06038 [Lasallia pustulata]